jgi:large subunit ribosomal protein L30
VCSLKSKLMRTEPVKKLFVTLTRSFAGTKKVQKAVLENLGFTYRLQTVEKPNNAPIRGAINKVRPLCKLQFSKWRAKTYRNYYALCVCVCVHLARVNANSTVTYSP